ncbi:Gag-Pol polyprotein [Gossypium australe]|uniref:Gag-Pol polyprotein n=1 Tax=Gossypium australe TaxID=47621 RepID=A0A5B6W8F0_9ROSI|nr:Gag-Pol polyprotein [Gossypium australe]
MNGGTPLCRLYQEKGLHESFSNKNSGRSTLAKDLFIRREEFLELKQCKMTVTEYEREFVKLSKYARECVSTEAIMCKRFEDGLNEDIRLFVGVLELKEFVVLVDRACKAEELAKEKRKAEIESHDSRKRQMIKGFYHTISHFNWVSKPRNTTKLLVWGKHDQIDQNVHSVVDITPVSAELMRGSPDHFIRECPEMVEKEKIQSAKLGSATRGRNQRNPGSETSRKNSPKEQTARPEARVPARTYAICAREDASSPDVITGTFSLYDTNVVALIDPGSTHSYICMKLVSSMSIPVEPTEFVIKVSNLLSKCVLVDKVCKNCPLMIKGLYFKANLMLFPFDEFDIILGMDWLTTHDVTVNCGKKYIELRCENGDTLCVRL